MYDISLGQSLNGAALAEKAGRIQNESQLGANVDERGNDRGEHSEKRERDAGAIDENRAP
jgi:hypothetical protein